MFLWDSVNKSAPALNNVSLVGVGSTLTPQKSGHRRAGGSTLSSFDLSSDFTMNLDAAATGATNYNTGVELVNVQYFDIENLITVQNATNQPAGDLVAWPTSARAVIRLHARTNSPVHGPELHAAEVRHDQQPGQRQQPARLRPEPGQRRAVRHVLRHLHQGRHGAAPGDRRIDQQQRHPAHRCDRRPRRRHATSSASTATGPCRCRRTPSTTARSTSTTCGPTRATRPSSPPSTTTSSRSTTAASTTPRW